MHTPNSFSAFASVDEALDMAVKENVQVVGINDFYTTKGYTEWAEGCARRYLYPLFNIEFISLNEEDQKAGLRVNDPGNPGRTYISGKGLSHPFRLEEPYASMLSKVQEEANAQVKSMCEKLNDVLAQKEAGFQLNVDRIIEELTNGALREKHLAKALRIKAYEHFKNNEEIIKLFFKNIFGEKDLKSAVNDFANVENEIRANLLKAGGAAFVAEDPKAFLPVKTVCDIIIAAGGIPTYPFLADDAKGNYTDFEGDMEKAAEILAQRGFSSVEFITTRNDVELLDKYVSYLDNKGFIVTLGSEHNTPAMEPIELFARGSVPLTENLQRINYEGACVIAAHQHLVKQGLQGYIDANGKVDKNRKHEFIKLGDQLINSVVK